jgi:alcohol dehydrogenase
LLVEELKKLNKDLGLPDNLAQAGARLEDIPVLLKDCVKTIIFDHTARQTTEKDIIDLYTRAINGL